MKLLMLKARFLFIILTANIFFGCSDISSQKTIVFFENPQFLEQEKDLLIALGDKNSYKNLSKFLNNQNWINSFLIKKNFFKPLEIFIESKEPKYIWHEKFYLDENLSKFLYLGDHPDLLRLNTPIELVYEWLKVEKQFNEVVKAFNLKISSVTYTEAEGWYFKTGNNLRINMGSDLSCKISEKLSLTLKYIFEKNLTPGIIDLRYKDGAALNYAK
tara:strand:- start:73 stop:720 length:648 start_codon:yes stop_codon:yes gene_type:complete